MDGEEGIQAGNQIDTLLDHQTQRLEYIANNAVDFIKINLLVLGAFAPFLATVFRTELSIETVFSSSFVRYATITWVISSFLSTVVYRVARGKSTSQFDLLEQAIVNDWRNADLRDEMLDNSEEYKETVTTLMIAMAVGVGLSLVTVLYFALGVADAVFDLSDDLSRNLIVVVGVLGFLTGFGIEILRCLQTRYSWSKSKASSFSSPNVIGSIAPKIKISISPIQKQKYDSNTTQTTEFLTEVEDLSPIRARLIKAIREIFDYQAWDYGQLSSQLREEYPDIGLTKEMIERLCDDGYIRDLDRGGPSTIIIHERTNEVVNGKDLDKVVGEELGRVIGHMREDDAILETVSEALNTTPSNAEHKLVSGTTSDRIDKLNQAISVIDNKFPNKTPSGKDYGKIQFRNQRDKYQLTPEASRPFALVQIQRAQDALIDEAYIQATVLASRALEEHMTALVNQSNPAADTSSSSLGFLLNSEEIQELIDEEDINQLNQLREIRNKAVHNDARKINAEEVEELLSIAETIVVDYA